MRSCKYDIMRASLLRRWPRTEALMKVLCYKSIPLLCVLAREATLNLDLITRLLPQYTTVPSTGAGWQEMFDTQKSLDRDDDAGPNATLQYKDLVFTVDAFTKIPAPGGPTVNACTQVGGIRQCRQSCL